MVEVMAVGVEGEVANVVANVAECGEEGACGVKRGEVVKGAVKGVAKGGAAAREVWDRPIAFHRSLVRLGLGVTGALLLSQALFWSRRTRDADGWFYKTQAQWEAETGLTRYEQESARRRLVAAGYLDERRRGVPCRLFFRVDVAQVRRDVAALGVRSSVQGWLDPVCEDGAVQTGDVPQALYRSEMRAKRGQGVAGAGGVGGCGKGVEGVSSWGVGDDGKGEMAGRVGVGAGCEEMSEQMGVKRGGKREGALTLQGFLAQCEARGEMAVPAKDAVFEEARVMGLPQEFVALAWWQFKARYVQGRYRAKRYVRWRAVFREAVRENWLRLWWFDAGQVRLTVAGEGARRLMEGERVQGVDEEP